MARLAHAREQVNGARARLRFSLAVRLRQAHASLEQRASQLGALSPLACLARGYAIVRRGDPDGPVVRDAAELRPGDAVALVFARGRARGRIERTES